MASINLQGDTSGSISISAPSIAGSNTLTLPATTQTLATQNSLGVRNLIINGDMRIAQRGTSSTGQTSGGYVTVDRFYTGGSTAGTWTITQDTDTPTGQGFATSLKMDCTTANASLSAGSWWYVEHKVEAQNCQHLKFGTASAETLTLSFWVKSNKTGTYTFELYRADSARHISNTYTINSADTWEKKTIAINSDSTGVINNDNGEGLRCLFWVVAGTNYTSGTLATSWAAQATANRVSSSNVNLADNTANYINITAVQLEVGTEATPFEHRPYDMELQRCQRYYEAISKTAIQDNICNAHCWNTTTAYGVLQYATKRAAPSFTLTASDYVIRSGGSTINVTSTNINLISIDRCQFGLNVASGLTVGRGAWFAFDSDTVSDQKLEISAEL